MSHNTERFAAKRGILHGLHETWQYRQTHAEINRMLTTANQMEKYDVTERTRLISAMAGEHSRSGPVSLGVVAVELTVRAS